MTTQYAGSKDGSLYSNAPFTVNGQPSGKGLHGENFAGLKAGRMVIMAGDATVTLKDDPAFVVPANTTLAVEVDGGKSRHIHEGQYFLEWDD